jgi:hypothetical protein
MVEMNLRVIFGDLEGLGYFRERETAVYPQAQYFSLSFRQLYDSRSHAVFSLLLFQ